MARLRNLPADVTEFSGELEASDRVLGRDEMRSLPVFANAKLPPAVDETEGVAVLRRCSPGRILCQQADAGATAFYILTAAEVPLLQRMLDVDDQLDALDQPRSEGKGDVAADLKSHKAELEELKNQLLEDAKAAASKLGTASDASQALSGRAVAEARLQVPSQRARKSRGLWDRMLSGFRGQAKSAELRSIPVDGPALIDRETMAAPLHEGEVFGEMSCLRRVPRSATVVATEDCYMIEMMLVAFKAVQGVTQFKQRLDELYKKRTLSSHLRQFSFLADLTDDEFQQIQGRLSLETFQEGDVLFDEFEETTDCAYLIRSGLVQVKKGMNLLIGPKQLPEAKWKAVATELLNLPRDSDPLASLFDEFVGRQLTESLQAVADGQWGQVDSLRQALNRFITNPDVLAAAVKSTKARKVEDLVEQLGLPEDPRQIPDSAQKVSDVSQVLQRVLQRLMLERLSESLPRRGNLLFATRTLSYLGRGSHVGEMGVLKGKPRNATCIAFEDDSAVSRDLTGNQVEVVRLDGDTLRLIKQTNPKVSAAIELAIKEREAEQEEDSVNLVGRSIAAEMDELRIVEGQQLMLVDLERCTRCGECINACVDGHDDGNTRLYLEGPTIGKYLIPMTCRECVDPYCMRECPVSSIYRGSDGEMVIADWCIGCENCVTSCPFGSIHMNPLSPSEIEQQRDHPEVKPVNQRATVCDLCASTPSGDPLCVYACPHDAAIRLDGRTFYELQN